MLDEIPVAQQTASAEVAQPVKTVKKVANLEGALSALANLAGTREVEIDLPILGTKVFIQPVNGSEELRLRTMKASGAEFVKSFNRVIFAHARFEGLKFDSVEDFEDHLTPPDKAMMTFALLDATFAKLPEKMIKCPACGTADTHSPEPLSLMHPDTISKTWDNEIGFESYELASEIVPGFTVFYGMPTETERIQIITSKENSDMRDDIEEVGDVLSAIELFSVYIKRIEILNEGELFELSDKVKEVIPTIQKMLMELQAKLLADETIVPLVEFTPSFYLDIKCSNLGCSKPDFKWDNVNPEQDFFLKALSVYN
jgi:hypothetical protein